MFFVQTNSGMTAIQSEGIFIQAPGHDQAVRQLWPPETMEILRNCSDKHEPASNYTFTWQDLETEYIKEGNGYMVSQIQWMPALKTGFALE